ncbi:MAG: S8 family serine peptidase [Fibrobacter sp.]|nr:S8 family serine peptidase [Fibrobacter sp.]
MSFSARLILSSLVIFSLAGVCSGRELRYNHVPGRLLVKFKDGITPENSIFKNIQSSVKCRASRVFKSGKNRFANATLSSIYELDCKGDVDYLCDLFEKTGLFEYVEPDYLAEKCATKAFLPNDRYFYRQWALHNEGTFNMGGLINPKPDADIDMPEAWEIEQGDSTLIIAILDSGCKMEHPELAGRIWRNPGEVPENGIDDDGNGFIDDVNGWDFVNDDNDPSDDNGHGTSMTGIIGANGNNEAGFVGINLKSKLMIIKVTNSAKTGSVTNTVKGIEYAVNNGAKLINLSLGSLNPSETEMLIIEAAFNEGIFICASAGNNADSSIGFPAAFEQVLAVGATGPNDFRWNEASAGSNYGAEIDIVAPGDFIFRLDTVADDRFDIYASGTSSSAAFATGVASLLLSQNPTLTPTQIMTILRETAEDQVGDPSEDTPGWDKYYGAGRLNAYNALQRVLEIKKYPFKQVFTVVRNPETKLLLKGQAGPVGDILFTLSGRVLYSQGSKLKVTLPGGVYVQNAAGEKEKSSPQRR